MLYPELFKQLESVRWDMDKDIPWDSFDASQLTDEHGSAECFVRDDGAGISEDRRQGVFEKYETDSEDGGLGLGLAIVAAIAQSHGGSVAVASTPPDGARFTIDIPLAPGETTP